MFGYITGLGSPFAEFRRLEQELDELFGSTVWSGGIRSLPPGTFPAVNVGTTPDKVAVYIFAPGIDPKTLEITLQQNLLSISGRRETPAEQNATYYRKERFSGEFRRVISLPENVEPDRVDAKYTDGIVQITVQRRAAAQPRQIEIH